MKRSRHLAVIITHRDVACPYFKRSVSAVVCFKGQRNPTNSPCYRCPDGAHFEEEYGTRVFNREVINSTSLPPQPRFLEVRVPISKKKYGIPYTYAHWILGEHRMVFPFHERVKHGTWLTGKEMISDYTEEELEQFAVVAARERQIMRRGSTTSGLEKKKMPIGAEMQKLIDDRKRRDKMAFGVKMTPEKLAANERLIKMGEEAEARMRAGQTKLTDVSPVVPFTETRLLSERPRDANDKKRVAKLKIMGVKPAKADEAPKQLNQIISETAKKLTSRKPITLKKPEGRVAGYKKLILNLKFGR